MYSAQNSQPKVLNQFTLNLGKYPNFTFLRYAPTLNRNLIVKFKPYEPHNLQLNK